jgi:BirA family transcriptional regulator, biotin operon repressor / biotin---[acetyl-CoA-carboxylase] ligase
MIKPWMILHFDSCESTNQEAQKYIKNNIFYHPLVLAASHQTSGRGQMGNSWYDENGKNLLCSFILPVENLTIRQLPSLNMYFSYVFADELSKISKVDIHLKWPNDLLCNGFKIGGILAESVLQGSKITQLIIGTGINIDYAPESIPHAKKLNEYTSTPLKSSDVLERLVENIAKRWNSNFNSKLAHSMYHQKLAGYQKWRYYQYNDQQKKGYLHCVDEAGRAEIRWENENVHHFYHQKEISWIYELNRDLI